MTPTPSLVICCDGSHSPPNRGGWACYGYYPANRHTFRAHGTASLHSSHDAEMLALARATNFAIAHAYSTLIISDYQGGIYTLAATCPHPFITYAYRRDTLGSPTTNEPLHAYADMQRWCHRQAYHNATRKARR